MKRERRLDGIVDLLNEHGEFSVEALTERLGVSVATIRRDLDLLQERGLVDRTHGGARRRSVAYDLPLRYRAEVGTVAKQAIALRAVELIPHGGVVGLSGGTTTAALADQLRHREDLLDGLTVVTNAVDIASHLAGCHGVKVVVTGGVVNSSSYELVGSFADDVLRQVWLDVAFIGVNAFSATAGGCTVNEHEATVNRHMAARSAQAVVLADATKYGKRSFAAIGGAEVFSTLVTDSRIAPEAVAAMDEAGYEVLLAPLPGEHA